MLRLFGYVRVSSEEQVLHGLSIEAQTLALEAWAREHGHKLIGLYIDAGISARKKASSRPELQRLLADVQAGKGDLIIFTKLDRWFRNIAEYYKVQEILEKHHVNWRTIQEDYDTSTASGRLKINIMLSVAQDEADRTGERIKAVFETKREKREPLGGNAPTGYMVEGKKLVKDPAKEPAVNAFFQKFLASGSISLAQQAALEAGLRIEYQLASKMLDSPAYYGTFYGAEGMTPPYITKDEFERIQSMRYRVVRKTIQNRVYLFSGLISCGDCGCRMSGRTNRRNKVALYNCPGHYIKRSGCENKVNISEKKIEAYLLDTLDEKLRQYQIEVAKMAQEKPEKSYKQEISALRGKIGRLKELYINDLISLEEYRTDYQSFSDQITKLEALEQPQKKPNLETIEKALCQGWRGDYEEISREEKREFWRMLLREIRIYPDRHIEFDLKV